MQRHEQEYRYRVVDVFTENSLEGNALAVFLDASTMDATLMQRVARELNLAETAFILPSTRSDCVARVRIFTPMREMTFAGHPTIGTGFVLLEEGLVAPTSTDFMLEEQIGAVPLRVETGTRPMLWLRTPSIETGPRYDPALCARVLGLESADLLDIAPQRLSAGNPTLFVPLRSKEAVDRAWLDHSGMKALCSSDAPPMCVFVFAPTTTGAYSRMFAPEYGVVEDPATGSSTGPLAQYMMRSGLASSAAGTRWVSEQGVKMGRRSLLHIHVRGQGGAEAIEIGGHVTPVAHAVLRLPIRPAGRTDG